MIFFHEQSNCVVLSLTSKFPYGCIAHKDKWHYCGQIQCACLNTTTELVYILH